MAIYDGCIWICPHLDYTTKLITFQVFSREIFCDFCYLSQFLLYHRIDKKANFFVVDIGFTYMLK